MWFKLLINKTNEPNTFKIKKNKIIYVLTNIVVFSIYISSSFFLIISFILKYVFFNMDLKLILMITLNATLVILLILTIFINPSFFRKWIWSSNTAFLIHSKYLVDKFLYFYKIDLSHLILEYIKPEHKPTHMEFVKYLKEKDISKLVIIDNIKNSGRICKVYAQDKEKAIKLMKLRINFFYILTEFVLVYIIIMLAISILITYIL